jgi:hypothetical protein
MNTQSFFLRRLKIDMPGTVLTGLFNDDLADDGEALIGVFLVRGDGIAAKILPNRVRIEGRIELAMRSPIVPRGISNDGQEKSG